MNALADDHIWRGQKCLALRNDLLLSRVATAHTQAGLVRWTKPKIGTRFIIEYRKDWHIPQRTLRTTEDDLSCPTEVIILAASISELKTIDLESPLWLASVRSRCGC